MDRRFTLVIVNMPFANSPDNYPALERALQSFISQPMIPNTPEARAQAAVAELNKMVEGLAVYAAGLEGMIAGYQQPGSSPARQRKLRRLQAAMAKAYQKERDIIRHFECKVRAQLPAALQIHPESKSADKLLQLFAGQAGCENN